MKKILQNLHEAEKIIQVAEHMIHVVFPLIKEKNFFLKFLLKINLAMVQCVSSVLHYEYLFNRINLSPNKKINLNIFNEKCAWRYGITVEEKKKIFRLFELAEKHKQSVFEFKRGEKIVILSKNLESDIFNLEEAEEFLHLGKNVLRKILETIQRDFSREIHIKRS